MKKNTYILILVFLTYGNSFADSLDSLNIFEVVSTDKMMNPYINTTFSTNENLIINEISLENDFLKNSSCQCLDFAFLMNSESNEHDYCEDVFDSNERIKTVGITTIYYTPMNTYKTTNDLTFQESDYTDLPKLNLKFKRLQNINLEEHFSEPLNPAYFKGFGLRIKI